MKKLAPKIAICAISMMLMATLGISPGLAYIAMEFPEIGGSTIALLITAPTIVVVIVSLIVSTLNQFLSKKKMALLGIAIICIAGVAPFFLNDFWAILITRIIMGIGIGLINPIAASLPIDHYEEGKDRSQALGLQSAFSGGSAIVFTLIGGYLAVVSWKANFLVYLVAVIAFIIVLVTLPDLGPVKKEEGAKFTLEKTAVFYSVMILVYMAFFNTLSLNMSYLVGNVGASSIESGYATSAFSLLSFLGGLVFAQVAGIFKRFTLGTGLLLSAIGLIIMGMGSSWIIIAAGAAVSGFGMCTVMPSCIGKIARNVPPGAVTFSISLFLACSSIGQFLTPYAVDGLVGIGGGGIQASYIFPGIAIAVMAILFLLLSPNRPKQLQSSSQAEN